MIESELDVLRDVSHRLESAGIDFMLTGSMALNYYAQPRMTRDIDIVVELTANQTQKVLSSFSGDYYVDHDAVINAITHQSIFNLIHNNTIIKVDCIVRKNDAYHKEEFRRRIRIDLGDFQTWVVTREDLILSKLAWANVSGSELQLRDIKNLLGGPCDMGYVESRAKLIGLELLLSKVLGSQ